MGYYRASEYYSSFFGEKVYRIALDAGCTCPNRDGTCGTGGCIFCSGSGSGEFAADRNLSVTEQLSDAKARVEAKCKSHKYIAYFQNFTNTYGDEDELRRKYIQAISDPEVVGLSIATRPDAISEKMYGILEEVSSRTKLWIELGLQTIHEESARWMNRGYGISVFEETVRQLHDRKIDIIVHVILDLPVETRKQMMETIDYCASLPLHGIKIANLNVLAGTRLYEDYEANPWDLMEMDEYIAFLGDVIEHLPKEMVIYRLTGDGDKKHLVAPLWVADKRKVRNRIVSLFAERDVQQGRQCRFP